MYPLIFVVFCVACIFLYFLYKFKANQPDSFQNSLLEDVTTSKNLQGTVLPENHQGNWLEGEVTSVTDGDSFQLLNQVHFRQPTVYDPYLKIRLTGIDAPESGGYKLNSGYMPPQPFSKEAKDYFSRLILHETVRLKVIKIDQYKRILAMCYVSPMKMNVNLEMVKVGLACVYDGRDAEYDGMRDEFQRAESNAKKQKLGMWQQKNVIKPMEYKRQFRTVYS